MVKEAASLKKNNLFGDSTDLQCVSQSSLADSRTPPLSAPSSPPVPLASATLSQQAEQKPTSSFGGTINEESRQKSDPLVIPTVTITVSSPESVEPPLSVAETGQSDPSASPSVPELPSSPDSKAVTSDISVSETETETTTFDAPTTALDVSSTKPETDSSTSGPEEPLSEVKDADTEETLPDKKEPSAYSSSSSGISDQAVYLNSTPEPNAESPVPPTPANMEVPQCAIVKADDKSKDITQSEIENGCVQHDVSANIDAEVHPDLCVKDTDVTTALNMACEAAPSIDEKNINVEEDIPRKDVSPSLDSVTDGPVEDAVALTSELVKHSDSVPEEVSIDDSVNAIRNLIMEVIEVEDEVRPCVEN